MLELGIVALHPLLYPGEYLVSFEDGTGVFITHPWSATAGSFVGTVQVHAQSITEACMPKCFDCIRRHNG